MTNRIVYIEDPKDANYFTRSVGNNVDHSFYEFFDSLSGEPVYILVGINTNLRNYIFFRNEPLALRLTPYYYRLVKYNNHQKTFYKGYYNAKEITQKQFKKLKDEYPELFI